MADFSNLGLKKEIINVLTRLKFTEAFEVQEKIIPMIMKGGNLVFTSETGSGKTLAYTIGHLSKLNKKQGTQMIVLLPTRELCIQVGKELTNLCTPLGLNVGTLYGGRDISGDYKTLVRKNHIMVGTPGRLIQHINEKKLKVGEVMLLVFDESDQMFDHGFEKDCAYLKTRVSKTAQVVLASATITDKVRNFVEKEIADFDFLEIGDQIPENIVQEKYYCDKLEKNEFLLKLFRRKKFNKVMIFCNTKLKVFGISEFFKTNKFRAEGLSSDLLQNEREDALNLFRQGQVKILIATDVAARGLHIPKVDMVINYDVPTRDEFYVHRIGRTGRKNETGYSLTLICPEDDDRFANIEFDYELKIKDITPKNKQKKVVEPEE